MPDLRPICLALVLALALQGCVTAPPAEPPPPHRAAPSADTRATPARVLDWYHGLGDVDAQELARLRRQYADRATDPEVQARQALLALHPAAPALARARGLLEGLLANPAAEARELQPLARVLLEQVAERQRLDGLAQRQLQQAERSSQQLRELQQLNSDLQGKLDALSEIERSLSGGATRPPVPEPDRPR